MIESLSNFFRMPAEWERHDAIWITWPKNRLTFPENILPRVEEIYLEIIKNLSPNEKINLVVDDENEESRVRNMLPNATNVFFYKIKTSDVWVRDYGPIFVKNLKDSSLRALKWRFNAWGEKYDDLLEDNESGRLIAKASGYPVEELGMVLEGGSIDVNGSGTLMTTKQCLLGKNRNPKLNQDQIENNLKKYLGISNILWLGSGIEGDDTDGHIDDIARFVSKNTVLCAVSENEQDSDYSALKSNLEILNRSTNEAGDRLNTVLLPIPKKHVKDPDGARLPATYANFYIGNSVVLVPLFDDENDEIALRVIQSVFPSRKIIGINCEALVTGFGGLHCISQQQPESGKNAH